MIFMLRCLHRRSCNKLQAKLFFLMTDGSEMPWAERQQNALVRMSEVLNLKNQTVSRHSLQIQTALRHSLKKPVLGQSVNPKLLEKPWAGGTLFFRRFRCLNSQGTFRAVKEHSVLSSPNFNRTKKATTATTFQFASFSALSTCVKASKIQGEDGGRSGPPITRSTRQFAICDTSL
jgi:hypothetical protein